MVFLVELIIFLHEMFVDPTASLQAIVSMYTSSIQQKFVYSVTLLHHLLNFSRWQVQKSICSFSCLFYTYPDVYRYKLFNKKTNKKQQIFVLVARPLPCFCTKLCLFPKKKVAIHTTRPIMSSTKFLKLVTVVCLGKLPIQTG